ncbi:AAA family ATPase [Sedimentibacter hydroxybenzoicus DSM 7310]|uniref:AAA family ATPase n=1 Tax=Sedimentibacter hydroxybenzoicus DSM 7310 TaxID=1123245 RepID=A0A974BIX0_SEDHY|nr:AAA family ATPase [Sedimentibacter hydroxybenzoicus]NYB73676.1 AAA family ATPase [Sedimentibacter hydroxybenzoicus DSM 7310]
MYISKLHLRSFGKFIHKKIYFDNKLNIVYGENEAGKSTVHNFMEAMLYGFDDTEDGELRFNKYKPWNSNLYKGTLSLKDANDERYLISKDFLLGTSQAFFNLSQEHEAREEEILNPGEHFFNMNKISFSNTVSVKQLGNKTEKELAKELKNKIVNLSRTRDESISIDRIFQRLNSIKEEAGNENDGKSLLGQYSLRLKELNETRENSVNAKRQVMFLAMEKKKVKNKIHEINVRIDELKKELSDYEYSKEKEILLKAEPIKKELEELNNKLLNYKKEVIIEYSESDFKGAVDIENTLKSMYKQIRILSDEAEEKEDDLFGSTNDISNKIGSEFDIDRINSDYSIYKENNAKINELKDKIAAGQENIKNTDIIEINKFIDSYTDVEDINRKTEAVNIFLDDKNYNKMKSFKRTQVLSAFLWVMIGGVATLGAWWYKLLITDYINRYYQGPWTENIIAGSITALTSIVILAIIKPLLTKAKSAKNEIESMECEFADHTINLRNLNNSKDEIIKESGCESFDEMAEKFNKMMNEKKMYEEKSKLIHYDESSLDALINENDKIINNLRNSMLSLNLDRISDENINAANEAYMRKDAVKEQIYKLNKDIELLKNEISKLDKEISFEEKRLNMILKSNGFDDLDSFKRSVEINKEYTELTNNINYKKNMLQNILGEYNFDELTQRLSKFKLYDVKPVDKQEYSLKIYKLNEEKARLTENINNILKEIQEIEDSTRTLAEIEEEIDFYENKTFAFKNKIKVAEITSEKIRKISDSIKGDFMPLLKKSISDNFSYLTSGRYSDVIIDEDMNITVAEEANKQRNIELESLSGGTLDQLYLSLRIGLGSILSGNQNIPLIFDDSFVQYDGKRLRNSLEMLSKESERRQIILFTCQEREAELAKSLNIKFNYIKL